MRHVVSLGYRMFDALIKKVFLTQRFEGNVISVGKGLPEAL
jgi:hypothetical protein